MGYGVSPSMDARWPPPQPHGSSTPRLAWTWMLGILSNPDTVLPRLHRPRPLCDPRTSLSAHAQEQHLGASVKLRVTL